MSKSGDSDLHIDNPAPVASLRHSDDPPAPRQRRRWLRWTLCVLAALGLVVFLLFRDEALEPADDLMPKVEPVAWDDTNGWKRMLDIQKRYQESSWSETRRLDEVVPQRASGP